MGDGSCLKICYLSRQTLLFINKNDNKTITFPKPLNRNVGCMFVFALLFFTLLRLALRASYFIFRLCHGSLFTQPTEKQGYTQAESYLWHVLTSPPARITEPGPATRVNVNDNRLTADCLQELYTYSS